VIVRCLRPAPDDIIATSTSSLRGISLETVIRTRSLRRTLDFISKTGEVFVQSIEYFAFGLVRGEIADQRGLGSIAP
jgi:hypothetical protein